MGRFLVFLFTRLLLTALFILLLTGAAGYATYLLLT